MHWYKGSWSHITSDISLGGGGGSHLNFAVVWGGGVKDIESGAVKNAGPFVSGNNYWEST